MQRVAPQPLEPDAEPEIILPLCEPETESMDADTDAPDMLNPAPRSTANKQARTGTAIIAALQTMPPQISSKPRAMARADWNIYQTILRANLNHNHEQAGNKEHSEKILCLVHMLKTICTILARSGGLDNKLMCLFVILDPLAERLHELHM